MKILMLNYEYPPIGGGAGRISKNIAEQLVLLGHSVTVITTWYNGSDELEVFPEKPTVIRIKSKRKKQFQSNPIEMLDWIHKTWKFLQQYLNNHKFDICFANFAIPGGWLAYKIKNKFHIPYCIISHGHDIPWFYKKQMFFYHLLTYHLIKKIVSNSHFLFVQSSFMKKNAEKFLGKKYAKKIVQIPNGVNPPKIDFNVRKKNPLTILFVGRLVKQKNPLVFVKAMKRLSIMQIPYHAYIIGDGTLRNKIEKSIRKFQLNHIRILGWLNDNDVWKYYEKSHVMVMPSQIEGMSISNLESLSAGLYLIATPVSGNIEMLDCCANGEIVPLQNDKEIANAIQRFYFEQYLKKQFNAEKYMNKFIETFSWHNIAKTYNYYLSQMLNQNED